MATLRGIGSSVGGSLPVGLVLGGTSTLYGPDGEVKAQWVKSHAGPTPEETVETLKEAFASLKPCPKPPARVHARAANADLLALYPIADFHLGMYSWAEETGEDFDVGLAENLLVSTMETLVKTAPPAAQAIILNLGDFIHSDSDENRTRRSGNILDVDTRYAKVLRTGVTLLVRTIQLALTRHQKVLVRNIPGNHDPYAALALTVALDAYFREDARVTVDLDPGPFWFHRFGSVLLGAIHGDQAKIEDMPGIMAAKRPEDWGATKYRYIYAGHWHQTKRWPSHERAGAEIEVFRTMAPKDSWSNAMGFVSGREAVAIVHHRDMGEWLRVTQSVKWPQ
jgi:hypothetical protein